MRLNKHAAIIAFALASVVFFLVSAVPQTASGEEVGTDIPSARKEMGESLSPSSSSANKSTFFNRLLSPDRSSGSLKLASSYDPNFNISSLMATVAAHYDHGRLWDQVKSGNTEFKLEAGLGSIVRPEIRTVASVNMLAVYFPGFVATSEFRPYLEAGIGAIYTDYRVERQGQRLNFNPQAGIGTEIRQSSGANLFVALRLNHISNGGMNSNNQGVNSLLFQVGRFF